MVLEQLWCTRAAEMWRCGRSSECVATFLGFFISFQEMGWRRRFSLEHALCDSALLQPAQSSRGAKQESGAGVQSGGTALCSVCAPAGLGLTGELRATAVLLVCHPCPGSRQNNKKAFQREI